MTNVWFDVAEVSVGQHFYWQVGPYEVHGQVLLMSWFVLGLIFVLSFLKIMINIILLIVVDKESNSV